MDLETKAWSAGAEGRISKRLHEESSLSVGLLASSAGGTPSSVKFGGRGVEDVARASPLVAGSAVGHEPGTGIGAERVVGVEPDADVAA